MNGPHEVGFASILGIEIPDVVLEVETETTIVNRHGLLRHPGEEGRRTEIATVRAIVRLLMTAGVGATVAAVGAAGAILDVVGISVKKAERS